MTRGTGPTLAGNGSPLRVSANHLQGGAISIIHRYEWAGEEPAAEGGTLASAPPIYVKLGYRHMYSVLPDGSRIRQDQWQGGTELLGRSGGTGSADAGHIHIELAIYMDEPLTSRVRPLDYIAP